MRPDGGRQRSRSLDETATRPTFSERIWAALENGGPTAREGLPAVGPGPSRPQGGRKTRERRSKQTCGDDAALTPFDLSERFGLSCRSLNPS
jgi:hypothetical protein